jgi:hypothetical protein
LSHHFALETHSDKIAEAIVKLLGPQGAGQG